MADLRCALKGLRATDIGLTNSTTFPGGIRLDLGCGVYVEAGEVWAEAEAEAAAMDRLAELATRAAAELRAASSGETR
ncbi:hypothetical protein [Microbispora triticiradicis]|uniref:hypothetical protein n=1 Tax=Microbispora triticiradicis TaxID=2200763 RepID=UPI001AD77930|nr:hypothetical protein [Microbispora triticiradicis]MBO4275095.1 hypothetical protein [Microbispora triticiradicis]